MKLLQCPADHQGSFLSLSRFPTSFLQLIDFFFNIFFSPIFFFCLSFFRAQTV